MGKGSVLVVGGGIAGVQSALDLAESGYKVYLLDKKPSIGGTMAQLDKTFPTNDCAMCILAPKLVSAGRHKNIELLTYCEIEEIKGKQGDFNVKIRKKSRFIDLSKCTGCAECERVCPVERVSEFDEGLSRRKAIYRLFPQAVPNAFTIEKEGISACKSACPAGVNVHGYVALISQGKFKEAIQLIRERLPFPGVCGRVCPHPCESECKRKDVDEPIAIAGLKRFVADWERKNPVEEEFEKKKRDKRIAVIGAGPAGLTCAYFLAKEGFDVNVFEKEEKPGGLMRYGIPDFRLPKDVLDYEIERIKKAGVEIKCGVEVGKDIEFSQILKEYDAVFVAIGATKEQKLGIKGEDLEGVIYCLSFLKGVNSGKEVKIGKKVAVIGGGNSAIDAARTAWRLGANVTLFYRRSRAEMPANPWEVEEAEEEGIKFEFLTAPVEILGEQGKVKKLKLIRMKLGEPDESGRRRPVPIPGSEFEIEVDTVIPAIGQKVSLDFLREEDLKNPKVFTGGDFVTGPATVIEAVAAGVEAAEAIKNFLEGKILERKKEKEEKIAEPKIPEDIQRMKRKEMRKLPVEQRRNFKEVELGFTEEEAIEEAKRCLSCAICSECKECVKVCEAEAIDHFMEDEIIELKVGAIIFAQGADRFDAKLRSEYGFGRYKNVITSIQFERLLAPTGPTQGQILRPSDNCHPQKIAFIQCVGSRDKQKGAPYCSAVCCMYAIKEAIIALEHQKNLDITIFYMDIRAYGKGFERYYLEAKEKGIKFVKCRVARIEEVENNDLVIIYEDEEGNLKSEKFNMVILSVGLRPSEELKEFAEKFDIKLNEYGFFAVEEFDPVKVAEGIYTAGIAQSPKDIPETVAEASSAASEVHEILKHERWKETEKIEYPPERDVSKEPVRIGVFVCHCGINIAGYLDVKEVVEYAKTLKDVVYAEDNLYTCSQDTQQKIIQKIKEYNLNRIVVAACTPRTHEPLFRETLRQAGLNPYLFEMANIRDQCSWIHMEDRKSATEKAKDLVKMAVEKVRLAEPLKEIEAEVNPSALVIGGGLAGMTSALSIAEAGFQVYLVEKEKELGGNLRHIYYSLEGKDVQKFLKELIEKVENHPKIKVYKNAKLKDFTGFIGNYESEIEYDGKVERLKHGVVIVAIGAKDYKPKEYLYGEDERILTQKEFEEMLAKSPEKIKTAKVICVIQCVGSRDENHKYCSRICCSVAMKNLRKAFEINPELQAFVLYKDIRTYSFYEKLYDEVREKGAIFIKYEDERKPEVFKEEGVLKVKCFDYILGDYLLIEPDYLVLSTGIECNEDVYSLSKMLKVPVDGDGFLLEAHVKLRPVDFATDGIFLCGLCHSPKNIKETICQAKAAAGRALTILTKTKYTTEPQIARVNEEICSGCGICVSICPFDAIKLIEKEEDGKTIRVAKVEDVLCKGCGTCAGACPSGALEQSGFTTEQLLCQVNGAL